MRIISSRAIFEYTIQENPLFAGIEFDGVSLEEKVPPQKVLLIIEKGFFIWTNEYDTMRSVKFASRGDAEEYILGVDDYSNIFNT